MTCVTGADFDVLISRDAFQSGTPSPKNKAGQDPSVLSELTSKLSLSTDSPTTRSESAESGTASDFSSSDTTPTKDKTPKRHAWHTFTLLARTLSNPALSSGAACPIPPVLARFESSDGGFPLDSVLRNRGVLIKKYADLWEVDGDDDDEVKDKIEELVWVVTLLYGVGGWSEGKEGKEGGEFVADFFMYVNNFPI